MTLYALLVAIDAYVPPVNALYGSRNDAAAFEAHLRARTSGELDLVSLLDAGASRQAVIDTFRSHLGKAASGDVALFFYAGHGTQEPAPPEVAHLEPSKMIQTLVVHDCLRRIDGSVVRPLADKELALLIDEVAAGGAHVVTILDCCHSGHGTRDVDVRVRAWEAEPESFDEEWRELVAEAATPRRPDQFVPGALDRWGSARAPHVAISACRSSEKAKEHRVGGDVTRGAFSRAFVEALNTLGPKATYRSVIETARSHVERSVREQSPQIHPSDAGGLGDGRVLDGAIEPVPASFSMTRTQSGWAIDAGTIHGLHAGAAGDEPYLFACEHPGGAAAGMVRVATIEPARSIVEPIEWMPDDVAYRAVIAAVPLPPVEVVLDTDPGSSPVTGAVAAAIASSGPTGSASPHVRVVAADAPASASVRLRVVTAAPDVATICRLDGEPLVPPVTVSGATGAAAVASTLDHIARWEQVRGLCGHPSPLADAVKIAVAPADGPDAERSAAGPALASIGGYRLEYRRADDGGWLAPYVFIDVVNTAEEALCVAVLNLTDRFRCHPVFPAERLAAGHTVALWSGAAIPAELPAGRSVEPGAKAIDWLVVIASDVDFDADAFVLPALGEPLPAPTRAGGTTAPTSTLERLARRAVTRDIGAGGPVTPARWSASAVTIETVVPPG